MNNATRSPLLWLLNNRAHLPADLLVPFTAAILRRQVTADLATAVLRLDDLLDTAEDLRLDNAFGEEPTPALLAAQQDIEDCLTALNRLPAWPRVGDKVQIAVGDPMLIDQLPYPGVVVGYNDGTSVRVATRSGEALRTAAQCRVTDRAVYVPVPSDVDSVR
jgi:hypothetical protein